MTKISETPSDFIMPLDMNGLSGRMLRIPGPKGRKTEILFVYGQHSSLERWWGLMRYVSHYGTVTAPDLPGLGGMESFYKLGKKPTVDNFADYLAAFVKMRFRHKKVIMVGMSFGFVVLTRMLQRYPELTSNVEMAVSLVGMTHADDLSFSRWRFWFYRILTTIVSHRLPALFFRYICLNRLVLRAFYSRTYLAKHKFSMVETTEEYERFMNTEIWLWQHNDARTHAVTTLGMLTLDNCQKRLDVPVWHVNVNDDQFFDHHRVEQHLRITFSHVRVVTAALTAHAPSVIADEKAAAALIPTKLRRVLSRL